MPSSIMSDITIHNIKMNTNSYHNNKIISIFTKKNIESLGRKTMKFNKYIISIISKKPTYWIDVLFVEEGRYHFFRSTFPKSIVYIILLLPSRLW